MLPNRVCRRHAYSLDTRRGRDGFRRLCVEALEDRLAPGDLGLSGLLNLSWLAPEASSLDAAAQRRWLEPSRGNRLSLTDQDVAHTTVVNSSGPGVRASHKLPSVDSAARQAASQRPTLSPAASSMSPPTATATSGTGMTHASQAVSVPPSFRAEVSESRDSGMANQRLSIAPAAKKLLTASPIATNRMTGNPLPTRAVEPNVTTIQGDRGTYGSKIIAWSTFFGGADEDAGRGIAVDPFTGSTYITGRMEVAPGVVDLYVAEVLPGGGVLAWAAFIDFGFGDDEGHDIVYDPGIGAMYVTGTLATPFGDTDAFVMMVLPGGFVPWVTALGGAGDDGGNGIAVNPLGVYMTGYADPIIRLAADTVSDFNETLIANLDPFGGGVFWAYGYDVPINVLPSSSVGNSIDVDFGGVSSVIGTVTDFFTGDADIYVFEFDPLGLPIAGLFYLNPGPDSGNGVTVTPAGLTYATGCFFNGFACDTLVANFAPGLAPIWGTLFASVATADLGGYSIVADLAGYSYIAGYIDPLPDRDAVVWKVDPTGTYVADFDVWGDLGSGGADMAWDIDLMFPDLVYVTGVTESFDYFVTPAVLQPFYGGPIFAPPPLPVQGDATISEHFLPLP